MPLTIPQLNYPKNPNPIINQQNIERPKPLAAEDSIDLYENFQAKYIKNKEPNKLTLFNKLNFLIDYRTDLFQVYFTYGNTKGNSSYPEPTKLKNPKIAITICGNDNDDYIINQTFNLKPDTYNLDPITFGSYEMKKILKFSQLKTLSFSFTVSADGYKPETSEYVLVFDQTNKYKKDLVLPENSDRFYISLHTSNWIDSDSSISYNSVKLELMPRVLSQGKHHEIFLGINNLGVSSSPSFYRIKINPKTISNIPFKKNNSENPKFDVSLSGSNVIFNQNTYYDFETRETKLGAGPNSHPGYVIPYDYDKTFYPTFEFDLNQFKDLKLTWTQKINKPYFDNDKGIIKLKLENNNEKFELSNQDDWIKIYFDFFKDSENRNLDYQKLIEKLKNQNTKNKNY